MATAMVRSAFQTLLEGKGYPDSVRFKSIKGTVSKVLEETETSQKMAMFDDFARSLHCELEALVTSVPLTSASHRQSMWENYHRIRINEVADIWRKFVKELDTETVDTLLQQMINDIVFNDIVKFHTPVESRSTPKKQLSPLEETIIRYASGYVPRSLIKRYVSREEEKYAVFVDCLINMSASCQESIDCSFFDYTKRWTSIVNRGGLFETNEQSFLLFREIELVLQSTLESTLLDSARATIDCDNRKEKILCEITSDEDVLFHWSLSAVCITNEDESMELLKDIVQLWLTIRGFSLAKEWMEQHKITARKTSYKSKGLRKTLKDSNGDVDTCKRRKQSVAIED